MNTQSLQFRLIGWYAWLLFGCFALLGVATYLALRSSLVSAIKENQLRRARQIAQLLREEIQHQTEAQVGKEIETRYAPDVNDRFVRISQKDGVLMYLSSAPKSQAFEPATVPPPEWAPAPESSREVLLLGGRALMLTAHSLQMPGGVTYLVETGAPMDEVQAELRKWLLFLGAMLPTLGAIALIGGHMLVRRALAPVDQIAASAESISSHNLDGRLPVTNTGDELERLSIALNHMIERLDGAFQHSRRFVADASHELRTPLTVLKGELEDFVRQEQLAADWRDRLGSALEEVERLTNTVEGLFAISRLDAGEAAAECVQLDLTQLVSATADQMSLLAEDKRIKLTCTGSDGIWVQGDRARLKQVVVNLLDNAIKYTLEGGIVGLTVSTQNGKAILEVVDNGIGIVPKALPQVFERFFRVDTARSRDQGGAGLGLSIVKSICTAHHGNVTASSMPGRGSCFRVELPRLEASAPPDFRIKSHEH